MIYGFTDMDNSILTEAYGGEYADDIKKLKSKASQAYNTYNECMKHIRKGDIRSAKKYREAFIKQWAEIQRDVDKLPDDLVDAKFIKKVFGFGPWYVIKSAKGSKDLSKLDLHGLYHSSKNVYDQLGKAIDAKEKALRG